MPRVRAKLRREEDSLPDDVEGLAQYCVEGVLHVQGGGDGSSRAQELARSSYFADQIVAYHSLLTRMGDGDHVAQLLDALYEKLVSHHRVEPWFLSQVRIRVGELLGEHSPSSSVD